MLAHGVKEVLAKNLINPSDITVNIKEGVSHTLVDTYVGTLVIVDDPSLMIRVFSDKALQAKAIVLSTSEAAVIEKAMASLMDGNYFIDPAFEREAQDTETSLTDRQCEILQLFADGTTTGNIAKQLGLSTETIRTHTKRIIAKLNARNRTHAVAIALTQGSIHPPKP